MRFTKDHDWIVLEDGIATTGITAYAASQLGDIVFVELPAIGKMIKAGDSLAVVESVKAASDLNFPIAGEEPNPIPDDKTGKAGYPITATFPENQPIKSASAILTDGAGREVAAWFSSPETPANPKFAKLQGNTVCLIAKEPFRPGMTYTVLMRGTLGGQGWQKSWQFTTGSAGPSPARSGGHAEDGQVRHLCTGGGRGRMTAH